MKYFLRLTLLFSLIFTIVSCDDEEETAAAASSSSGGGSSSSSVVGTCTLGSGASEYTQVFASGYSVSTTESACTGNSGTWDSDTTATTCSGGTNKSCLVSFSAGGTDYKYCNCYSGSTYSTIDLTSTCDTLASISSGTGTLADDCSGVL